MPTDPPADPSTFILHCKVCGRARVCPAGDALGYCRVGWPRCCGGVMDYYLPGEPIPGAGEQGEPPPK